MDSIRRFLLKSSAATASLALGACAGLGQPRASRADPFIESLLDKMTLDEKAGQLSLYAFPGRGRRINPDAGPDPAIEMLVDSVARAEVTGFFNGNDLEFTRRLQNTAVKNSRLGIPLIFAGDVIHGFHTIFPVPLAEAASFDPDLCLRTARAAAIEATAQGVHWTFAPMVDIARDQRWGRVVESAGEDPWLGIQLAVARVKGFQGSDLRAEDSLLACPKHFAAYGAVQGGMEYNSADIPETTLRDLHLPAFQAAFAAGALSTMSSFNDIAGVPSTGNHHLLTEILRDEWGFTGLVVSDYESEKELIAHGFAADEADATLKAISAGCDMSMQSGLFFKYIPQLVRSGRLSLRTLDEAVRRVLRVKKSLGLFDDPFRSLKSTRNSPAQQPEFRSLAREAARKSIVLLKNDGTLPLPKNGQRIALIGPFVSDRANALGPWAVSPDAMPAVTLEEGIRAAVGSATQVAVVPGSDIDSEIPNGVPMAVATAQAADIVVLYLGEGVKMSGEAASRVQITIPSAQLELADAVAAVGKPCVVLLKHGRALELAGAVKQANAIVCTWFLGSESGHAIADVLFGDHAPQGRLPVSFPQSSGQEPYFYNHRPTGRPQTGDISAFKARYREVTNEPLYPFGHGLGYSTVEYGPTRVSALKMLGNSSVQVTALLKNNGPRAQHEIAQLYIHDKAASITQPVRALKGVQHIDLPPGGGATVAFSLSANDLRFVHTDLTHTAQPGEFDVWIASSSLTGIPATFELV